MNVLPAYTTLSLLSDAIKPKTYSRKITIEQYDGNDLVREDSGKSTLAVKDSNWVCLDPGIATELSRATKLFLIEELYPKVCMYNLLWYYPNTRKTQPMRMISELLAHKIIYKTESKGMYLLNPIKIWRGNQITAVEATKQLILEHRKPSPELVHDLRPGAKYLGKTAFDILNEPYASNELPDPLTTRAEEYR